MHAQMQYYVTCRPYISILKCGSPLVFLHNIFYKINSLLIIIISSYPVRGRPADFRLRLVLSFAYPPPCWAIPVSSFLAVPLSASFSQYRPTHHDISSVHNAKHLSCFLSKPSHLPPALPSDVLIHDRVHSGHS